MDAWLERYLDLAADDAVGAVLLDPRPAFAISADGGSFLWANAPATRLLRARSLRELAARPLGQGSRLREQLARLSRTLPADRVRREALLLPLTPWPAACRRLNLPDGTRAVLAVSDIAVAGAALRARADELATQLAGPGGRDSAVAIVDDAGRLLAASDAFDPDWGRAIADAAGGSSGRPSEQTVEIDGRDVRATMVGFAADGHPLRLVVVDHTDPPTTRRPRPVQAVPTPPPAAKPPAASAPRPADVRSSETAAAVPPPPAAPPAVATALTVAAPPTPQVATPPTPAVASPPSDAAPKQAPPPTPVVGPAADAATAESAALSGSDADAFQRIREALVRNGSGPYPAPPRHHDDRAPPAAAVPAVRPPFDASLLDRLPIGIVVFRDRKVLLANRALLDLLGHDSSAAFEAAGGVDSVFADGTQAWASGDFDDGQGRLVVRTGDGRTVQVEARLNAVDFNDATALMLSVIVRPAPLAEPADTAPAAMPSPDPTAAERRILELETILNTATDGVLTVDRHGAIMSMNRAAEALFAVDVGDFKGRSFTELLAEESRRTALDYLDGLAANGVASVLNDGREVIGRVPHGGLIPLYMTMGRLGDSARFSAVLRDITHWKTIEEELTSSRREAEAANAQKSEFLAKISHEIRTPLNAIIGFSEIMMEQRFGPIGNDRYRAYLNDIHVSGAHLISLINDLLDLSKIEAGKVDLTFEAVPVNTTIQECVALMQPLANRERIIIRTSLSTDLPSVVADQRSFRQILLNLLSNAIKFTRAGGQVIVSTLLEDSGEVVVRIRDTGIGMSLNEIETAMKPFEQIATARDDRDKGTGLGLPLTKAMVEANRAAFAIESAPNQGTLVRITFPTSRVLAS